MSSFSSKLHGALINPLYKGILEFRRRGGMHLVGYPDGFPSAAVTSIPMYDGASITPYIYRNGTSRTFRTNVDLVRPINEGGGTLKFYVDPVNGSDANYGTEISPFKSINKSITAGNLPVPDEKIIYLKPGLYDKNTGWNNEYDGTYASVTQIVPWGDGDVVVSQHHPGLIWGLESGTMYSATIGSGGVATVFDSLNQNTDGDYNEILWVASSALVESTYNSWYLSGTKIYINTFDGREPDSTVFVYANVDGPYYKLSGGTLYMENVHIHGGARCFDASAANDNIIVLLKNCSFKYSGGEGSFVHGVGTFVYQNCIASMNKKDGISWGNFNTASPFCMEINCVSRWNGWTGGSVNQGSTCHSGTVLIRINCEYYKNEADNVADVSSSKTWALGCVSRDSRSVVWNDWSVGNGVTGDDAVMWLDSCSSGGSTAYAIKTSPITSVAYIYEFEQSAVNYPGSVVIPYTP